MNDQGKLVKHMYARVYSIFVSIQVTSFPEISLMLDAVGIDYTMNLPNFRIKVKTANNI